MAAAPTPTAFTDWMAGEELVVPVAGANWNANEVASIRSNNSTALANTQKGLFVYNGENDIEIVDQWCRAHAACCQNAVNSGDPTLTGWVYILKYVPVTIGDVVFEWHRSALHQIRNAPTYRPLPWTNPEGMIYELPRKASEMYQALFYERWAPRNLTARYHAEMNALALGDSFEALIQELRRLRAKESLAVQIHGASHERALTDRECIEVYRQAIRQNPVVGSLLKQQLEDFMTRGLQRNYAVVDLEEVIANGRAALTARQYIDGALLQGLIATPMGVSRAALGRAPPASQRYQPYGRQELMPRPFIPAPMTYQVPSYYGPPYEPQVPELPS
ncbi:hypothetical protein HDU88_001789, partial [Geranomyces variabilis]